jgi:hypothetical protein
MSLVMAIANKNGIVVSGDWRLTVQYPSIPELDNRYPDTMQKIYKTKKGHVFGMAGAAYLADGTETGEALYNLVLELNKMKRMTIKDELIFIRDELSYRSTRPVYLLAAGIEKGKNKIYQASTDKEEIIDKIKQDYYGIGIVGMVDVALSIIYKMGINTSEYSIEELADLLRKVNMETSQSLKEIKSVSEECDIIYIIPDGKSGQAYFWRDPDNMVRFYKLKA